MSQNDFFIHLRPEIAAAYREARARGLPDGWTCSIDKRNRRKWTAPNNGRSCDSIPKALAISIDLGLLPPDTKVTAGKRKRSLSPKQGRPSLKASKKPPSSTGTTTVALAANEIATESPGTSSRDDDSQEDEPLEPPSEPLDPETSLEGTRRASVTPKTVHWDPQSPDGRKIGWKVRIAYGSGFWAHGRIIRYDPHSHKHKLLLRHDDNDKNKSAEPVAVWIWLRNTQHNLQIATRMVWAHVKGYAWWPALVMETNTPQDRKPGYVQVEFFSSGEVSTLRDAPESIRPFSPYQLDPVVAKHKKKRNVRAFQLACDEFHTIRRAHNDAAIYYAECAVRMAQWQPTASSTAAGAAASHLLVGKRVQVFRSDVNYPYGDTVAGQVRKYSPVQKKWLVAYELSQSSPRHQKYDSSWINLLARECSLKVLDKTSKKAAAATALTHESLIPYLVGFEADETPLNQPSLHQEEGAGIPENDDTRIRDQSIVRLLTERCRGCVEYLKQDNSIIVVVCEECNASYHLGCFDPPLSLETWQRLIKDGTPIVCSQCTPCRGCYQKDIAFGSHVSAVPSMLSFPRGESLQLCSTCQEAYDANRFCPNCAHTWDDVRFHMVNRQIEWAASLAGSNNTGASSSGRGRPKSTSKKDSLLMDMIQDTELPLSLGSFTGDDVLPGGAKVDSALFHPETPEWGYTEVDMLVCDSCNVWVHAGCAGITEEEYEETSDGNHPIYSKEFLCRMCCRKRCKDLIKALEKEDTAFLFAEPVSERVAPNYLDVIKIPMDLQTMREKADSEEYLNYAWVRELFELMVLNALTFNRHYTKVWNEAKRYYQEALTTVFETIGKAAPPRKYAAAVEKRFALAEDARKKEVDRVQVDESVEKKDLVAGSLAVFTSLPELRQSPPDQKSCVPYNEVELTPVDAFYSSWMDSCYTCGSCGAADTMLFCVDCGEAFHSFCVNAPIHSMDKASVAGWRCPNCKICEISGEVPQDETRMLYCEMCDRGFCLDLLDPPLSSAPPGLWICGQCVECKSCGNKSEPLGASLRHWSRFPDKCYRCGGCEGIADHCTAAVKCQVCVGLFRKDDTNVAVCNGCGASVHARCDHRASEHVSSLESASRAQRAQKEKTDHYFCPSCSTTSSQDFGNASGDRQLLSSLALWGLTVGELLPLGETDSIQELHAQVIDAMEWKVRELWRHEYLATIRDGVRLLCAARQEVDPSLALRNLLSTASDTPKWKLHRALRFVALARRMKLEDRGCALDRIDAIVLLAKLAASFIDVTCCLLETDPASVVAFHHRILGLLQPPTSEGTYEAPFDPVRCNDPSIVDGETSAEVSQEDSTLFGKDSASSVPKKASVSEPPPRPKIASPLCGWADQIGGRNQSEWKDPRECCLCHICGDNDAGFVDSTDSDQPEDELEFSPLGRLLPMSEGFWVHTSCALWSSEVWEAPTDGLVNAMDKARSRGGQLKCFGCGRPGATVGCCKSNCPFNYHFPCAKVCGAVFTDYQRVYCAIHKTSAINILVKESFEHMKALFIAPEEKKASVDRDASDTTRSDLCVRVGALTVHSLGTIDAESDKFHSENYITPQGYVATRIFWSCFQPRTRTVYVLKVEKSALGRPEFTIIPGDDPSSAIYANSVSTAYSCLVERVRKVNAKYFSQGDMLSKLPATRRTRKKAFGLNGPQFFGFGVDHIRKMLESSPGVEAVIAPLTASSPKYRFCFVQPNMDNLLDLKRKRAAVRAEQALENSSGCARTEGIKAVAQSGGSGRITRALVRSAEEDVASSSATTKKGDEAAKADRSIRQVKYRRMKSVPIEDRLVPRRSHIHGWGLFTKLDIPKDDPIVEYMGETIRQPVGDRRERAYEISGEGSCYMFRLDLHRIVDATQIGCMARFMNHSCQPNAYAKIISVDTVDQGQERKIVVFANRDIAAGEEITYDYKFPVEDGSLRCHCGAPNCIGRLN